MQQIQTLEDLFSAFNNLKVLVVGDVMTDSYLWGKSTRISPEAPVPIVNVLKREKRLGGAANVALNVQAMGATPILCSVIGDDQDGADLIRMLEEKGMSAEGMVKSQERCTTIKHRIIAGGQQLLRVDAEQEHDLTEFENRAFLKRFSEILPKVDVVIFEDYDKGVLTAQNIPQLLQLAQEHNIPTAIDPKKKNFLNYIGSTLFKPNLKELKEGLKVDFADSNTDAFEQATTELQKRLNSSKILITLSERGVFAQQAGEKHYIPAHIRTISDVSGAGDTVISIAALCLALNVPLALLAGLANLGGGLVCEQVGVVPIDKQKLLDEAAHLKLFHIYADRISQ